MEKMVKLWIVITSVILMNVNAVADVIPEQIYGNVGELVKIKLLEESRIESITATAVLCSGEHKEVPILQEHHLAGNVPLTRPNPQKLPLVIRGTFWHCA